MMTLVPPKPRDGVAAEFSWKAGVRVSVAADVAAQELMRLDAERGGQLRPEDVVDLARPDDAPLHPAFEWDDGAAAELYRQEQARSLTRHLVVSYAKEDGGKTDPVRLFVKLSPHGDEPITELEAESRQPHVYTLLVRVMDDDGARHHYIRTAYKEGVAWMRRYSEIKEFEAIFREIEALGPGLEARS